MQKPGQKGKNSSSPDIRRNNNRVLQQSQNNLINQEEEASIYVQSYVPSFAQHVSTDNTKQSEQGNSNGLTNLNNSKKNTINDYPALLQQRGGLGANLGTDEWNSKKEKFDKMQEYSAQVKYFNQQQQVNLPPSNQRRPKKEEEKKVSSRDKALEFSKNIPKPKQKTEQSVTQESSNKNQSYNNQQYSESSPTSNSNTNNNTNTLKSYKSGSNDYQNQDEIDFEALERQHLEYLNKIERLNLN